MSNARAIGFYDGPDKELKELSIRVKKETDNNAKKDKIFIVTISNKDFNFNDYANFNNFGSTLCTKKLSLDEAKDEQKEILDMTNDLKKKSRPDKIGHLLWHDKQNQVEKLTENAKTLYKTKSDIINAFKKLKTKYEQSEETKETEDGKSEADEQSEEDEQIEEDDKDFD